MRETSPPRRPGYAGSMASAGLPRSWRWFCLLFGGFVPSVVWAFLLATGTNDPASGFFWGAQAVFVALEVLALARWLATSRRTPAREYAFGFLFYLGALFAVAWSFLILVVLDAETRQLDGFVWALVLSPFPCVFVYGFNALIAFDRASRPARTLRESSQPEPMVN